MGEAGEGATISGSGKKVAIQGTTVATDVIPEGTPLTIPWSDARKNPGREWTEGILPGGQQGEESGASKKPAEEQKEPAVAQRESPTTDQTSR